MYTGQWCLSSLQSRHLGTSHSAPSISSTVHNTGKSFVGIAISCLIVLSWISSTLWNVFPFKGDFSFGKSQRMQGEKSGLEVGWDTWVIYCFTKKLCMRHDAWAGLGWCCDEAANHQLPIVEAFWVIWIVSGEECSSLT